MKPAIRIEKLVLRPQPGPSEADEQCALVRWLDFKQILFCHCANGEARDPRVGAKLKRMGVRRGVPDILIFGMPLIPAKHMGAWAGVAIEMKSAKGKLTPQQQQWLGALELKGWVTNTCHSSRQAIAFLQGLGY